MPTSVVFLQWPRPCEARLNYSVRSRVVNATARMGKACDMVMVGIIGTGVGIRTHLPAFRDLKGVDVLAVAGSTRERTKLFADANGIKHAMDPETLCMLPELDLVCVTSPTPFHRDQAERALRAGKHVLCEKPLAMNVPEIDSMVSVARERPAQLSLINHQLRFNPYIKKVKEMVAAGAVGRPYFLRMHQQSTSFSNRNAPWNWSFDGNQGGGVRLAIGSHHIDLIHYWFGETAIAVQGSMDPVVRERRGADGAVSEVTASGFYSACLELASGMTVHLSATAASCGQSAFDFSLYGEEGELHFDLTRLLRGAFLSARGTVEPIVVTDTAGRPIGGVPSIFSQSFTYFAPAIVDAIRTEDWSSVDSAARFGDALQVQVILDELATTSNEGSLHRLVEHSRCSRYV